MLTEEQVIQIELAVPFPNRILALCADWHELQKTVIALTDELRKAQTAEANADAYAASLKRALEEVCECLEVDASRNVYLDPDDLTEDTWNRMNEIGCPAINAALEMKG